MASSAIIELRHIRTAEIDDPERVVQLSRHLLKKGGYQSAGDECTINLTSILIVDWTILDQTAVAALIIGNDTLAEVLPFTPNNLTKGLH
jgi:hypothetical protein